MKKIVTEGDNILFHYRGWFQDGEIFDSSRKDPDSPPLEAVIGETRLLAAFQNALIGMTPGQKKEISLKPDEAYGEVHQEAFIVVPKTKFPPDYKFVVDSFVEGTGEGGRTNRGRIESVGLNTVTLDMNHPLAGKHTNFEIELVDIKPQFAAAPEDTAPNSIHPPEEDCKDCKKKPRGKSSSVTPEVRKAARARRAAKAKSNSPDRPRVQRETAAKKSTATKAKKGAKQS